MIQDVDPGVDLVRIKVARAHEHLMQRMEEHRVDGLDELTVGGREELVEGRVVESGPLDDKGDRWRRGGTGVEGLAEGVSACCASRGEPRLKRTRYASTSSRTPPGLRTRDTSPNHSDP